MRDVFGGWIVYILEMIGLMGNGKGLVEVVMKVLLNIFFNVLVWFFFWKVFDVFEEWVRRK